MTERPAPPTIGNLRAQGLTGAKITCTGCRRTADLTWEKIGLPDETPFPQIKAMKRFTCSVCKSRTCHMSPDWTGHKAQGSG
jgi:hypothetical protein